MKPFINILLVFACMSILAGTTDATVRRVPSQYAAIQYAIDASANGDTVLVSEGTYDESIRYSGKAIVVASLYLVDRDTSHIGKTIIDGDPFAYADSGSIVYFIDGEDTTSVLCGFTITGGTGTSYLYNGIGGVAWLRVGGGVICNSSGARIVRNIITHNRVIGSSVEGGGLFARGTTSFHPDIILEGNRFTDNYLRGESVTGWAWSGGAGIGNASARVVGNVFERDTVVGANYAVGGGMSTYTDPPVQFIEGLIQGNTFRSNVVSATAAGGLGAGLAVVRTGAVTISENLFENNFGTSVSGWAEGGGLVVDDESSTGYRRKMIVNNRFLNNAVDAVALNDGGAVLAYMTLATLSGNYFANNSVIRPGGLGGGGIRIAYSSFRIENNIITRNVTTTSGGGVDVEYGPQVGTEQAMINNTIAANRAGSYGGGLWVSGGGANVVSLNNIFWGDTAVTGKEICLQNTGVANVHYCDVEGGWVTGAGNINVDPRFAGALFSLSDSSYCIGAGKDSFLIDGVWYVAPDSCFYGSPRPNPAGSNPDIGACENPRANPMVDVKDLDGSIPTSYALHQNYPNPFNPSTTIRYELPHASRVGLKVYNTLGQEVATIVNETKPAGVFTVEFDARSLASGIYFYRIQAGDFVDTKKLILLR